MVTYPYIKVMITLQYPLYPPLAAVIQPQPQTSNSFPRNVPTSTPRKLHRHLNIPVTKHRSLPQSRKTSSSSTDSKDLARRQGGSNRGSVDEGNGSGVIKSVSGILFALKHWIGKHFYVSIFFVQGQYSVPSARCPTLPLIQDSRNIGHPLNKGSLSYITFFTSKGQLLYKNDKTAGP